MPEPVPLTEIGYQVENARFWNGVAPIDGEDNPQLVWPKSVSIYDKMRREESQIVAALRAITLPIRRAKYAIDGTGCRDEVTQQIADDFNLPVKGVDPAAGLRTRDRFSWNDHLRHALLELPFGHSFFEQQYRIDDSGMARLRKLAWRPPRTISKITVADDGGLESIEQFPNGTLTGSRFIESKPIPVDRLVAYVNEREGGNWLGQSLLRPSYKYWLLKDIVLRIQAQAADRNGLGIPIYTAPTPPPDIGITPEQWKQIQDDYMKAGLELAKAMRSGQNAGGAIPAGSKLDLVAVTGKLYDTAALVQYYDEQMAKSVLEHFLNLGSETGSWALGSTFADFFVMSLQATADHIVDVTNAHVIEDLIDLNFGPDEPAPRLVVEEIGSRSPITAEAIYQLVQCKALTPDEPLEQHLRSVYGLPARDESTTRTLEENPSEDPAPAAEPADPAPGEDPAPVVPDPGEGS